jgi:hypothetical protein
MANLFSKSRQAPQGGGQLFSPAPNHFNQNLFGAETDADVMTRITAEVEEEMEKERKKKEAEMKKRQQQSTPAKPKLTVGKVVKGVGKEFVSKADDAILFGKGKELLFKHKMHDIADERTLARLKENVPADQWSAVEKNLKTSQRTRAIMDTFGLAGDNFVSKTKNKLLFGRMGSRVLEDLNNLNDMALEKFDMTKEQVIENMLSQGEVPRRERGAMTQLSKGVGEGMSLGILGQDREDPFIQAQYQQDPLSTGEKVASVGGQLAGGLVTYGGIAKWVGKGLQTHAGIKSFATAHPYLYGATVQNLAEEGVESSVRLGTGQEYGVKEFIWGMSLGGIFETGAFGLKSLKALKEVRPEIAQSQMESMAKTLTETMGRPPTNGELFDAMKHLEIDGTEVTYNTLFKEARMAHLKGGPTPKGGSSDIPGKKTSKLFKRTLEQPADAKKPMQKVLFDKKDDALFNSISNKETAKTVRGQLAKDYDSVRTRLLDSTRTVDEVDVAAADVVVQKLNKLGDDASLQEAANITLNVSNSLTKQGRAIQAASMWDKLSPAGVLMEAQRTVRNTNDALKKRGIKTRINLTKAQEKMFLDRAKKAQNLTGRPREVAMAIIRRDLAEMVPTEVWDMVGSTHALMMLGNFKTLGRNIIGNGILGKMENMSDRLGFLTERGVVNPVQRLLGKDVVKTKRPPIQMRKRWKAFWEGFVEGSEEAYHGIDLTPTAKGKSKFLGMQKGRTFKPGVFGSNKINNSIASGFVRAIEKTARGGEIAVGVGLKGFDRAAFKASFKNSMDNQAIIAGKKFDGVPTQEMIETAYAESLFKTLQDDTAISNAFVALKKNVLNLGLKFGPGDFILKFPKVPGNLLDRAIRYSPAGYGNTLWQMSKPLFKRTIDQKEVIESFSRATVGSGLMFIGMKLREAGVITGQLDENRNVRAAQQSAGYKDYQINLNALKRYVMSGFNKEMSNEHVDGDEMMTYDWLQPTGVSLAMGADMYDGGGEVTAVYENLLRGTAQGLGSLEGNSLLRGLSQAFRRDADGMLESVAVTLSENAASSFVPTMMSQVNQLGNHLRRETYDPSPLRTGLNRMKAKIPYMSSGLPKKSSTLGKEIKTFSSADKNLGLFLVDVFINPAMVSEYKKNPGMEELMSLYEVTGDAAHMPRVVQRSIKISGGPDGPVNRKLKGREISEYQHMVGADTKAMYEMVFDTPQFQALTPEKKAKEMGQVLTNINTAAKIKLFGHKPSSVNELTELLVRYGVQHGRTNQKVLFDMRKEALPDRQSFNRSTRLFRDLDNANYTPLFSPAN